MCCGRELSEGVLSIATKDIRASESLWDEMRDRGDRVLTDVEAVCGGGHMSVLSVGDARTRGFRGLTGTGGKKVRDRWVGGVSCLNNVEWRVDWEVSNPRGR